MTKLYGKEALKSYFDSLIDSLEGEWFTLEGTFGWTYIECEIREAERE